MIFANPAFYILLSQSAFQYKQITAVTYTQEEHYL